MQSQRSVEQTLAILTYAMVFHRLCFLPDCKCSALMCARRRHSRIALWTTPLTSVNRMSRPSEFCPWGVRPNSPPQITRAPEQAGTM